VLPGIILAAGRSSRFGRPKALLPAGATTFVGAVLSALAVGGIEEIVVVTRPGDSALASEVPRAARAARIVENPKDEAGQLSSLLAALDAVDRPGVDGVLVTLVDVPLVTAAAVRALIAAHRDGPGAAILRATHRGRHGHPVIFTRETFAALRAADEGSGAKAVMRQYGVLDVEVDDPGVVEDVDTPADYVRLFGREP
jgi:CTP:molybdopterin cytidylyltransferase MocA